LKKVDENWNQKSILTKKMKVFACFSTIKGAGFYIFNGYKSLKCLFHFLMVKYEVTNMNRVSEKL